VVICLERGADLHMAQLMPLLLTVSCFCKIQIGFTFLVPAYPGSPGKRAAKRVCVCAAWRRNAGSATSSAYAVAEHGLVWLIGAVTEHGRNLFAADHVCALN